MNSHHSQDEPPCETGPVSPSRAGPGRTFIGVAVVLCGLLVVALKSLAEYHQRQRPVFDELTYLELSNDLREAGGWRTFLPRAVSGEYREANRHPLYLLMLSTLAERDPSFYPRAKLLSWLSGLVATGVLLIWVSRWSGAPAAALAALLIAHNSLWIAQMSFIAVEMLLFAWLLIAWSELSLFWQADVSAAPAITGEAVSLSARPQSRLSHAIVSSVIAGAALGLAYLTKATALIVLVAFVLAALLSMGWRAIRSRAVWVVILAWAAVSGPLLIRNVRVYGSPIYNVNSRYMWLDDWSQVPELEPAEIDRQSLMNFVDRRGWGALAHRVVGGLVRELSFLLTGLSPLSERVTRGTLAAGAVVLLLGLAGVRHLPSRFARWFTWLIVLGFVSALALHTPRASHPRFQLTLVPILYATALLQLSVWWRDLSSRWRISPAIERASFGGAIGVLGVLALVSLVGDKNWREPWPPSWLAYSSPPDDERDLAAWMQQHLVDSDVWAIAPGCSFSPLWYRRLPGRAIPSPELDAVRFREWAAKRQVTYVVLDRSRVPKWAADWPTSSAGQSDAVWTLAAESGRYRLYRRSGTRS